MSDSSSSSWRDEMKVWLPLFCPQQNRPPPREKDLYESLVPNAHPAPPAVQWSGIKEKKQQYSFVFYFVLLSYNTF